MSCWICSSDHVKALAIAHAKKEAKYRRVEQEQIIKESNRIAILMMKENLKSYCSRYDELESEYEDCLERVVIGDDDLREYEVTQFKAAELIKLIHCYRYQASEHRGWTRSKAFKICQSLIYSLSHDVIGYEQAPWGFDTFRSFRTKERGNG